MISKEKVSELQSKLTDAKFNMSEHKRLHNDLLSKLELEFINSLKVHAELNAEELRIRVNNYIITNEEFIQSTKHFIELDRLTVETFNNLDLYLFFGE